MKRRFTEEQLAELRRWRARGWSLGHLAYAWSVSHECVRRNLGGDDPKPDPPKRPAIGDVCGRLTVVAEAEASGGRRRVLCLCRCGTEKAIDAKHLLWGDVRSCGCLRREVAALRRRRLITIGDRTQHLAGWLRELKMDHRTVYLRVAAGWSWEEALTRPLQHGKRLDGQEKRRKAR